ncbi:hypothetical protein PV08_11794 [Exophiala spinifera]|uniref:Uncharacterized protein n=1 Tax=Exophiala spinifera TaxID=91928 RepID=A0A0D2ATJ9_9EURO|nr:uncharacterized protein PV08_11794 [Exophiala spinifera]KIW10018.1 hypothetical protein PV08_11794 [Exophiala spinifera]
MSIKLVDFSESSLMPLDRNLDNCDVNSFSIWGRRWTSLGGWIFDMTPGQRCAFDIYQGWKQPEDPTTWRRRQHLLSTNGVWLGSVIQKCWTKDFESAQDLVELERARASALLVAAGAEISYSASSSKDSL